MNCLSGSNRNEANPIVNWLVSTISFDAITPPRRTTSIWKSFYDVQGRDKRSS
jgi:hypothetical protein